MIEAGARYESVPRRWSISTRPDPDGETARYLGEFLQDSSTRPAGLAGFSAK